MGSGSESVPEAKFLFLGEWETVGLASKHDWLKYGARDDPLSVGALRAVVGSLIDGSGTARLPPLVAEPCPYDYFD